MTSFLGPLQLPLHSLQESFVHIQGLLNVGPGLESLKTLGRVRREEIILLQEKGQSFTFNQLPAHRTPQISKLVSFQPLCNQCNLLRNLTPQTDLCHVIRNR